MEKLRTVLVQLTFWVMLLVATVKGTTCPPPTTSPSLDEMIYYSDVVVLGKALAHYSTSPNSSVFTAEFQVYCVYKGDNIPAVVNITGAGNASDACFSTQFVVGNEYLAYLHQLSDKRLTPAYPHNPEKYKEELLDICGFKVSYPVGVQKESAKQLCEPDYYDEYDEEYDWTEKRPCIPAFVPKEKPTSGSDQEFPYKPGKPETDYGDNSVDDDIEMPLSEYEEEMEKEQDDQTSDKEVAYKQPAKTGKVEEDNDDDDNGRAALCASPVLSLALLHAIVLLFRTSALHDMLL